MDASSVSASHPAPPVEPAAESAAPGRTGRRVRVSLAVAAAGCAVGALIYLGTWPPFAVVESGSMAPAIKAGDIVVLKRLDRPPRVGDIVAVRVPDGARSRFGYPPEVTHRVVRIARNGDFTTKGDALKAPDPFTVRRGTVRARVVAAIPAAGRAFAFLTSTIGLVWLALGAVLLIALPLLERRREAEAYEHETIAALRLRLDAVAEDVARIRADAYEGTDAIEQRLAEITAAVDGQGERLRAEVARVVSELRDAAAGAGDDDRPPWDDRVELTAWELRPPPVPETIECSAWPLEPPAWEGDCPQPTRRPRAGSLLPRWSEDFTDVFPLPAHVQLPPDDGDAWDWRPVAWVEPATWTFATPPWPPPEWREPRMRASARAAPAEYLPDPPAARAAWTFPTPPWPPAGWVEPQTSAWRPPPPRRPLPSSAHSAPIRRRRAGGLLGSIRRGVRARP